MFSFVEEFSFFNLLRNCNYYENKDMFLQIFCNTESKSMTLIVMFYRFDSLNLGMIAKILRIVVRLKQIVQNFVNISKTWFPSYDVSNYHFVDQRLLWRYRTDGTFLGFSRNSELNVAQFLENLEEMVLH